MTENYCAEDCIDGTPCERPAGWGLEPDIGPCADHQHKHRKLRKLTEDVKQTLIGAAQEGAKHEHCAMLAGITPRTLRQWREWAKDDLAAGRETNLTEFYIRYQRARAGGAVSTLKKCDPEFLAERSYGYTKTEKHEIGLDTDHDYDAAESVTAEFVTYTADEHDE